MCRRVERETLGEWRRDLLECLFGEVLEIGAGTGLNLPFYPSSVSHLLLSEPDPHMRAKLRQKLPRSRAERVTVLDAAVDVLPLPDASVDAVVGTLVLCSVPDQRSALSEIRRVLRPSGQFVFLEHVAAEGRPRLLRWQRRVEPIWKRLAGNCHLTRHTGAAIEEAGFVLERLTREEFLPAPALVRTSIRGVARRPGPREAEAFGSP
jgi:ubiquinone/menaquinone biosynthesis C-methylase UbiE